MAPAGLVALTVIGAGTETTGGVLSILIVNGAVGRALVSGQRRKTVRVGRCCAPSLVTRRRLGAGEGDQPRCRRGSS